MFLMKATKEHCISEQLMNSLLYFQHAIHHHVYLLNGSQKGLKLNITAQFDLLIVVWS